MQNERIGEMKYMEKTLRWLAFGLNVCLKDRIPIPDKRSVSISLARQDFSQIRSETLALAQKKAWRPWIESSKSGIVQNLRKRHTGSPRPHEVFFPSWSRGLVFQSRRNSWGYSTIIGKKFYQLKPQFSNGPQKRLLIAQCLKITQKVAFNFPLIFVVYQKWPIL